MSILLTMRDRSVIIRHVMKVPKKLYLAVALLIFAGGATTALAMQPAPEKPKTVEVQQVAAIEAQEPVAEEKVAVVAESEPVEVVAEPEPKPEPESLKDEVARLVSASAASRELNVDYQVSCMDKLIMRMSGYENEAKARSALNSYTSKMYFGTGCKIYYLANTN